MLFLKGKSSQLVCLEQSNIHNTGYTYMLRKLAWEPGEPAGFDPESISNNWRLPECSRAGQKYIKKTTLKTQFVNIFMKNTSVLISTNL